ncbi:unnamed protein product [Angiostrongylus costaricensis]|uniref:G_PROTEIN_RECEP_F1_2 domain-containing protein n=1 Tax=Angiostrongylus costaricensis TaxID=334426 RepID=A0A0R3PQ82_ANGCS|nr:unnamed protein product [Angiostrongylus costaricensis]
MFTAQHGWRECRPADSPATLSSYGSEEQFSGVTECIEWTAFFFVSASPMTSCLILVVYMIEYCRGLKCK